MTDNLVSTETIVDWLKQQVEQKNPLPPSVWLDAAAKLTVLMGDESDKLFVLQQRVRQMQVDLLKDPKQSVSRAKLIVEASDEYKLARQQEAKIKAVEEFIRISKLQARLKDNEFRLQ